LYTRLLHHQIAWKEHTAGVGEQGATPDAAGRWYFPARRWSENLLPHFRADVLAHLEAIGVPRPPQMQHVLSSQVFALNLVAPFLRHPDKLSALLCDEDDEHVVRVEVEVAGKKNHFHEPGARGEKRTSADIGAWIETPRGTELALFEVRLTEGNLGRCVKGQKHGGICAEGGRQLVMGGGGGCPLAVPPYDRTYWKLLHELKPLRLGLLQEPGAPCPFRDDGYQLLRTQLLAAAMVADPAEGLVDARIGVVLHDGNRRLRQAVDAWLPGGRSLSWRAALRRPEQFEVLGAIGWLKMYVDDPELGAWAGAMLARYFPPPAMVQGLPPLARTRRPRPAPAAEPPVPGLRAPAPVAPAPVVPVERPAAVRAGHRAALAWMGQPAFAALKALHDRVLGPASVYYRPTDGRVVLVSLDPAAPCSVGFRVTDDDDAHELEPGAALPAAADLAARQAAHRAWLKTLQRSSTEERAVAAWMRQALSDRLRVPGLAPAWRFVAAEWRLVGQHGATERLDLVVVDADTGEVGLIEATDSPRRQGEAIAQIEAHGRRWCQDGALLTPFFQQLAETMWTLYGQDDVPCPTLADDTPVLFVAWPDAKRGLRVVSLDEM